MKEALRKLQRQTNRTRRFPQEAVHTGLEPANKPESGGAVPAALSSRNAASGLGNVAVGVDVPSAHDVVSRLLPKLGYTGAFSVVEKPKNLPEAVQDSVKDQEGKTDNVFGAYHGFVIYIIAGNPKSIANIGENVLRRGIGHCGVQQAMPDNSYSL